MASVSNALTARMCSATMPESALLMDCSSMMRPNGQYTILSATVGGGSTASWAVDSPVGGECKLTDMSASFAIGDFSRATHLTVKTLRHYHETGLLEPAHIDPQTGYRRYTTDQIPVAQIIRRFRDLDMPLNEIRAVLSAPA